MHLQEGQGRMKCYLVPSTTLRPIHMQNLKLLLPKVYQSNGLGEDTITRNVTDVRTDARTHGRRTDFGTKLIYHILSNEKVSIKSKFLIS